MYLNLAGPIFFGKTRLFDSIVLLGTLRWLIVLVGGSTFYI
jgi:hypothetical protein